MCFSAPASFAASGGIAVLGGASLKVAKKEEKILALMPILFSVQQAFEGIQWLSLKSGSVSMFAGYGFLFFAFLVWPIYVPAAVFLLDKKRKKILRWFVLSGFLLSVFFLIILISKPLSINVINRSIQYSFETPFNLAIRASYLLVVFLPLFLSSNRAFRWFGVAILAAAIISEIFFVSTFASVWCFFAALISSIFFVYLKYKNNFQKPTPFASEQKDVII